MSLPATELGHWIQPENTHGRVVGEPVSQSHHVLGYGVILWGPGPSTLADPPFRADRHARKSPGTRHRGSGEAEGAFEVRLGRC